MSSAARPFRAKQQEEDALGLLTRLALLLLLSVRGRRLLDSLLGRGLVNVKQSRVRSVTTLKSRPVTAHLACGLLGSGGLAAGGGAGGLLLHVEGVSVSGV